MQATTELELKFLVPAASRADVAAEMARATATRQQVTLAAMYLDTPDRRLARARIAWRLRREGRRWVQALKAPGAGQLERFEHEVPVAGPHADPLLHAQTPFGRTLVGLLDAASQEGQAAGVRYRTEVRRVSRRIRTGGALVEVAFDEGRVVAGDVVQRICEVEFELVSGPVSALLALAARWRQRFGLIHDPRTKSERGDRLADGQPFPDLRKSARPAFAATAGARDAFASVVDECVEQITRNSVGLCVGDPQLRSEHVHQLRVGMRRLRSALRSFEDWVPPVPPPLVEGLRSLFAALGALRDSDVLDSGVAAALQAAGAPALDAPAAASPGDAGTLMRGDAAQSLLLDVLAWRAGFEGSASGAEPVALLDVAARRLRRWHRRVAADWKAFDTLDEPALHALRKRIKRQRYAVEFFAPALRKPTVARYLGALTPVQERLGELNDLFVARGHYQRMVATDARAWFALGWLAARIAEARAAAGPVLRALVETRPPEAAKAAKA